MRTSNRTALAFSALVVVMLLPACDGGALQGQLNTAQLEIDALTGNLAALQEDYNQLQSDYGELMASYQELEGDLAGSLDRLQQSELEDPSWSELEDFLRMDDTDTMTYVENSFDCSGFAITLRDRAWRYGFRSAYVEIGFGDEVGHAVNAFDTTDKGLIFIDDTEADQIAYVEIGQSCGAILLDEVKSEYIDCSGSPEDFWMPLDYASHSNPFDYSYYVDYQERVQFYEESIDAYNEAVAEYNRGRGGWTYSQLTEWLENIEALEEDIGTIFEPMGIVESVELYWN